jgi:benzoyl-CoA reductase subunit C
MLPVGLAGAGSAPAPQECGGQVGTFNCSITRSTLQMGMTGQLGPFDAILFSSICDAARDLSFAFMRNLPDLYVDFVNLPHTSDSGPRVDLLDSEYRRVIHELERLSGEKITTDKLQTSIDLYNLQRSMVRRLYEMRAQSPSQLRAWECYVLVRAGNIFPVSKHIEILGEVLRLLPRRSSSPGDSVPVVLEGAFCEQPSLDLIQMLEASGCHIADDDFSMAQRWFQQDVPTTADPVRALAESYVLDADHSAVRHDFSNQRVEALEDKVRRTRARGVIMLAAKSCGPAFFDYALLKQKLDAMGLPHLLLEFSGNQSGIDILRTEVEAFLKPLAVRQV